MGTDPRILITGGSGQVGLELALLFPDAFTPSREQLDITDWSAVAEAVQARDVVVHLAAYTDVDGCESNPKLAAVVNEQATGRVAEVCSEAGCYLIFASTDYVFDGAKDGEYLESDRAAPLNVYGRTKLAGERQVLDDADGLVVRTSTVYGRRRNFIRSILDLLRSGQDRIEVVEDQVSRLTPASELAGGLQWAIEHQPKGILHLAGGQVDSRAGFAEQTIRLGGFRAEVVPVDTATYESRHDRLVAPRPRKSILSLRKAQDLGVPWGDDELLLKSYVEGLA